MAKKDKIQRKSQATLEKMSWPEIEDEYARVINLRSMNTRKRQKFVQLVVNRYRAMEQTMLLIDPSYVPKAKRVYIRTPY